MIIFRHFAKISSNIFHIICQNLIRQFLKVTFNEIFCKLALFLFYGTPAYYIASGNSCWLLWPKCWLETEFDNRFRLRFSLLIQLILGKCVLWQLTRLPIGPWFGAGAAQQKSVSCCLVRMIFCLGSPEKCRKLIVELKFETFEQFSKNIFQRDIKSSHFLNLGL